MEAMRGVQAAKVEGACLLGRMGSRWPHVQSVGQRAEYCLGESPVTEAAWLHDVGYAIELRRTGFHPLDGALWAIDAGFSPEVVALIAFHSGALVEAGLRGFAEELEDMPPPIADHLDMLNFFDMTSGPDGKECTVHDRISEILSRYDPSDYAHRAVSESQAYLVASAMRGEELVSQYREACVVPGRA
ncbi:MAG: hypothetical protein ACOH1Y_10130 [Propionicimonas sp.]